MTFLPLRINVARWPNCQLVLLLSDVCALLGTAFLIAVLRDVFNGEVNMLLHMQLSLFLLIAPFINMTNDLYSPTPPPLPEELRSIAMATSLAYLGMAIYLVLSRDTNISRLVFFIGWVLSLGMVPLCRAWVRKRFSAQPWWGVPTVLFGEKHGVETLVRTFKAKPALGFRPVAWASWKVEDNVDALDGLQNWCGSKEILAKKRHYAQTCAMLVLAASLPAEANREQLKLASQHFQSVVLVPETFSVNELSFWMRPVEIGQRLGLKLRQNLFDPWRLCMKRCMDLVLTLTGGLLVVPFMAVIALCIVIESPGSPFFRQERIGRGGRTLRIVKFRSMVKDAETCLNEYLSANPNLREEWEKDQKLRFDPRVTRVGAFLRRTSLDELPQLWNVLCGDMSLVGPRPIVKSEIKKYDEVFSAYVRVRPGITGLWQVSGRNDLQYSERVSIDAYYISNWSTWLDLYILVKTVPVVFDRKGAY